MKVFLLVKICFTCVSERRQKKLKFQLTKKMFFNLIRASLADPPAPFALLLGPQHL